MLVLDASVVIDYLLWRLPHAPTIAARIRAAALDLAAPELIDVEVAQVLRRFVLRGELGAHQADAALQLLVGMPIARYPHAPLIRRAFQLRDNTTVYDATYIALAEALEGTLLTLDARLATVPGHRATIEALGLPRESGDRWIEPRQAVDLVEIRVGGDDGADSVVQRGGGVECVPR